MDRLKFPKKIKRAELALLLGYVFLTLTGLFFFFTNEHTYRNYIAEDGFIEYLTAFLLLGLAANCFGRSIQSSRRMVSVFYMAAAFIFLFGMGEEMSWGQRIFGYGTPESLKEINTQQEFNLHNIRLYGVKLNKLIFGTGLYGSVFSYFLLFPILFKRNRRFRHFVKTYHLPLPKTMHSVAYFFSFLLLSLIPGGYRKWELHEFVLSGYLLLSFLFPRNLSAFTLKRAGNTTGRLRGRPPKVSLPAAHVYQTHDRLPKKNIPLHKKPKKGV